MYVYIFCGVFIHFRIFIQLYSFYFYKYGTIDKVNFVFCHIIMGKEGSRIRLNEMNGDERITRLKKVLILHGPITVFRGGGGGSTTALLKLQIVL